MITFRAAWLTDAFPVSLDARPIDRIEWSTSCADGITLTGQIVSAIEKSAMAWAVCWHKHPIALFGVAEAPGAVGIPWMITVPEMEKHPRAFVKYGRKFVAEMAQRFPVMVNFVHADNSKAQAWLRTVGFHVEANIIPLGRPLAPYYRFTYTHV